MAHKTTSADDANADYLIVGAGSAGCVLANRLSADPANRVILLEAGGDDRPLHNPSQFLSNLSVQVPAGSIRTLKDPNVNWLYKTAPDTSSGDRVHIWPRGKVLGGSSSINGMLYVRGQPADYDGWSKLGCTGWGWDDLLPYFRRAESYSDGLPELHGGDGPMNISASPPHPVSEALLAACAQTGIPRVDDINGPQQEGAAYFRLNIHRGRRQSSAQAYLHPITHRRNLRVVTGAQATRILFEGSRAVGVEAIKDGHTWRFTARCEVILSGGTVHSPQLLQHSGIGPGALLQRHGIAVRRDLPGVGCNLQDHYMVGLQYRLRPGVVSLNEATHGVRLVQEAMRYAFTRKGLFSQSTAHVAIFCKSRAGLATPDIQFHMMPATMDFQKLAETQKWAMERLPGLTLAPCQLRPQSRGTIMINSADPLAHPVIHPNYLSAPEDQEVAIAAVGIAREIMRQPALSDIVVHETFPGPEVSGRDAVLEFCRSTGSTVYHPVGTCSMGSGPDAVVDWRLRVRGCEGLRVVDASIMPRITSGNTHAPTGMIAEKASDLILADDV